MLGREGHFDTCSGSRNNIEAFNVVPSLFQSWTQLDPTTYVFTVRQGALWPARSPMTRTDRTITAADLVWFMDLTKRLQEFLAGRPDSRPDGGGAAWLTKLTSEQFETVCRWVAEHEGLVPAVPSR